MSCDNSTPEVVVDAGSNQDDASASSVPEPSNTPPDATATDAASDSDSDVSADASLPDASAAAPDGGAADASLGDATTVPTNGDASPTDADAAVVTDAVMFIDDGLNGRVYRYNISAGSDPVLTAEFAADSASGMVLGPNGELFIGQYIADASILRFGSLLATPTAKPPLSGIGGNYIEWMTFVDDELWAVNSAYLACTSDPQSIVRVAFDSQGDGTVAGTVTDGLIGADRALLWEPVSRSLYVTQCSPANNSSGTFTIQHFHVANDRTTTRLTPFTGNGLNNPHGMVVTPWGELLVANVGFAPEPGTNLSRFTLDAEGNLTPNGTIEGADLNLPINMAFTPWGELLVVNNGTSTLSRFSFDASHVAIPGSTFSLTLPTTPQGVGVGHIVIMPGTSLVPTDSGF